MLGLVGPFRSRSPRKESAVLCTPRPPVDLRLGTTGGTAAFAVPVADNKSSGPPRGGVAGARLTRPGAEGGRGTAPPCACAGCFPFVFSPGLYNDCDEEAAVAVCCVCGVDGGECGGENTAGGAAAADTGSGHGAPSLFSFAAGKLRVRPII